MDTVGTIMQWYGRANPLSAPASALIHAMLQARGGARPSAARALRHPLLSAERVAHRSAAHRSAPDLQAAPSERGRHRRSLSSARQSVQAA